MDWIKILILIPQWFACNTLTRNLFSWTSHKHIGPSQFVYKAHVWIVSRRVTHSKGIRSFDFVDFHMNYTTSYSLELILRVARQHFNFRRNFEDQLVGMDILLFWVNCMDIKQLLSVKKTVDDWSVDWQAIRESIRRALLIIFGVLLPVYTFTMDYGIWNTNFFSYL